MGSLRGPLLLALFVLLLAPLSAALPQKGGASWRVEGGRETVTVRVSRTQGYEALPLFTLTSVGAEISSRGDDVEVRLGGRDLRFRVGSAEFGVGGATHRLPHPVYREDEVTFVPVEFFTRVLPGLGIASLQVDADARTLRRVRVPEGSRSAPAPPPQQPEREAEPTPPASPLPGVLPGAAKPRRLVVVDAGHGGVDPGAKGPAGTREKDVSLAVARRLAAILREDPTLEVRMTRDRDVLVPLRERTRLANAWREGERPALFISIHCNANDSRSARGFETYFLSEAKTEDARRVAAMENAAQRFEKDAGGGMDALDFIFHDLRQNKYLRDSDHWASLIQNELREVHPGPDRGVKQAGFYVLNGAFMPAVLVELGFITNPREESLLADPAWQGRAARQLSRAIHAFFEGTSRARAGTSP